MNTLHTKTHSSKEMAEFSFENADVESICYCKQKMKSKLSLSTECAETKLCKLYTSYTGHIQSSCGMVWYRTPRVIIRNMMMMIRCKAAPPILLLLLRVVLVGHCKTLQQQNAF